MIISFGGKEYVSGESYAAEDILAAYKQGLRNGKWEAEEKHNLEVAAEPQYHYDKGYEDGKSFGINLGKDDTVFQKQWVEKERKNAYGDGYVKGHDGGWRGAVKAYGFGTVDKEYEKKLDEEQKKGFDNGYNEGYNTAIKEMSNSQALGETTEHEFGTEDCCEHHNPNKETQEAMQEVLNKDSNEFEGIWVAKDGSGKLKIVSVNEGYCDVNLVEHVNNSYLCVGDTATISVDDLKEHWNKERAEYNYNTTEDDQLQKELKLVEKYPHYYKDIRHLNIIDIYRFFDLFEVTDPCLQHSVKKLAVGGKRGAKDYEKDIKEAMDTLKRWEYMQEENKRGLDD